MRRRVKNIPLILKRAQQALHSLLSYAIISLTYILSSFPASATMLQVAPVKNVLKIAQVDWCPQICIYEDNPGYIIETLTEAFKDSEFELVFSTYPWSRGIAHTLNGQTIALLAAAPKETPDLVFPSTPIGEQQACFYTLPSSSWRYSSISSVDNIRIGLPAHISLEELNEYYKKHATQFHIQARTPRYIDLSIKMLASNRLDTFVFFRNTMIYHMRRFYSDDTVKQAGCVSATPVYIVFSPAPETTTLRDKALAHYEKRIRQMIQSGRIT